MAFGLASDHPGHAAVSAYTPFLSEVYWQRWFACRRLFTVQVPLRGDHRAVASSRA